MDENEKLFSVATAAFTAFDFDCLYLTEVVSGLGSVSQRFVDTAGALGKLSQTFGDYSALLETRQRSSETHALVSALRQATSLFQRTKKALAEAKTRLEEAPVQTQQGDRGAGRRAPHSQQSAAGEADAARPGLREEVKIAVRVLSDMNEGARMQLAALSEVFHSCLAYYFTTGCENTKELEKGILAGKSAGESAPALAPREFNVLGLPHSLSRLLDIEMAQRKSMEDLLLASDKAKRSPKSGLESVEEYRIIFGNPGFAFKEHDACARVLSEAIKSSSSTVVVRVADAYLKLVHQLESVYTDMAKNESRVRYLVETPQKKPFFSACPELMQWRASPLEYARSVDQEFQGLVRICGPEKASGSLRIVGLDGIACDARELLLVSEVRCQPPSPAAASPACHLYLFSDVVVLSSEATPGNQVLVSEGRLPLLGFCEADQLDVDLVWSTTEKPDEWTRVAFRSPPERDRFVGCLKAAKEKLAPTQIFGVALEELSTRDRGAPLLRVLSDPLAYVLRKGQPVEFECPEEAAALVRTWLRCLPQPLLTRTLFDEWSAVGAQIHDGADVPASSLRAVALKMPPTHYKVAAALFKTLLHVSSRCEANKMSVKNLAIVFTPTVLPGGANDIPKPAHFAVVQSLIANARAVFANGVL
eukprot:m51a1_g4160 hypothetical protein (648) ;mRNA; f:276404-279423